MPNKMIDWTAKLLASVGALNLGLTKVLTFDLLSWVPAGMFSTITYAAVGASGGYLLYLLLKKKI